MAGVIGVAVFSASLTRLTTEPARQGYGWDAMVKGFGPNDPFTAAGAAAAEKRLLADPDVRAVTGVWVDYDPRVNGYEVPGFAEQFIDGHRGFVIVSGRAPEAPDQVALGAKTLRRAKVSIGDNVDVNGKPVRVVGTTLFPIVNDETFALADGALFTHDGVEALHLVSTGGESPPEMAVTLRSAADRTEALARLASSTTVKSRRPRSSMPRSNSSVDWTVCRGSWPRSLS